MTRKYAHVAFCLTGLITTALLLSGCPAPPTSQVITPTPQVIMQGDTPGREEVQPIELDNCNGKGDAKRTEQRTRSIESTISAEIAAKFGASAEVLSAEIQTTVGAAMKWGAERSTSIELVAPPGTRMAFQLVWIGNEQVGIVQNLRASNIPIAFRSFKPTDVRIKSQYDIGCPPTPSAQRPVAPVETRSVAPALPPFVPFPECPSVVPRKTIEQWAQAGEITKLEAQNYIADFDRMRIGGEFKIGAVLRPGTAIVTDFGNGESNKYLTLPVRAIAHYHSYGVFEVTSDYVAVQTGACMTIMP